MHNCLKHHNHRADFGSKHAWEAQQAFARIMARGEAQRNIAAAALYVAAEDDALGMCTADVLMGCTGERVHRNRVQESVAFRFL